MDEVFIRTRRSAVIEDALNFIDWMVVVNATLGASDELELIDGNMPIQ
jgi:hypothetical protein